MLILPASIQLVHAFELHNQILCKSEEQHHFHQREIDCTLCHLQAKTFGIITELDEFILNNEELVAPNNAYKFLSKYQDLPFSSRGPPFFN